MNHKKPSLHKKGFSLFEISIALAVISILTISVIKGSDLIQQAKIASARKKTIESPILKINGLVAWFETTMSISFPDRQISNNTAINRWNNIVPNKSATIFASGSATYISSNINGLPALQFDSANTNSLVIALPSPIQSNQMEIFIVTKRSSVSANSSTAVFYSGSSDTNSSSVVLALDNTVTLQTYRAGNLSSVTHPGNNVPYIFSTTFDNTNNTTYLNGVAGTQIASSGSFNIEGIVIGSRYASDFPDAPYYNGFIAELIVFDRALSDQERGDVTDYLGKKWNIPTNITFPTSLS
ncbi:MAG: hypothetical protein K0R25_199 [Rickettsiaceae bacterium]|jgi:prepilin-type N-terminal cleavage/methylation domain-containing protein|nr:hypothetical protein [Rickettsiaceae bacterium]